MTLAAGQYSGVQKVSAASFPECVDPVVVRGQNFGIRQPFANGLQGPVIAKQAHIGVDVPGFCIGNCEMSRDLETNPQRVEYLASSDCQSNTATSLSGKFARVRREPNGLERYARQRGTVQVSGQGRAIDPGGANDLKRRVGAAPDRHIGRLQQADAGVQNRLGQVADVWRRVDPWEFRRVEIFAALPALHFNDLQVDIDGHLRFEKMGQFAHGHAVTNREAMETDKRLLAVVQHRARDVNTVDGVRSVENDKSKVVLGRRLHRIAHRRNVGIKARADVLYIEHKGIDSTEHFWRWPSHLAVKTNNWNTSAGFDVVINKRDVELPAKAVFRAENPYEVDVFGVVQEANGAPPVSIDTGVVGDQRNATAMKRLEIVARQNVDASQHGGVTTAGNQHEQPAQQCKSPLARNNVWVHHFQIEQHNYPTGIVVQCQKN